MTGWVAAMAMLGVALVGPTFGQAPAPSAPIADVAAQTQVEDAVAWAPALEQTYRVFAGSGGRLGVTIRDLSDEDIKSGKSVSSGVKVDDVQTDSPAARAGLKAGDVVVEFDGERVRSSRQFARLVQETPAGRSIQAAVLREGQRVNLTVQTRENTPGRFDDLMFAKPPAAQVFKDMDIAPKIFTMVGGSQLGITVDTLSPQLAEYFGTKEGVLVTSVNDNSAANKAGLKAGDVITSLNGGSVNAPADLRRRAQRLEGGDEFTLSVVRDRKPLSLKGKVEAPQPRRLMNRTIL
jgi:serine protease Do